MAKTIWGRKELTVLHDLISRLILQLQQSRQYGISIQIQITETEQRPYIEPHIHIQ